MSAARPLQAKRPTIRRAGRQASGRAGRSDQRGAFVLIVGMGLLVAMGLTLVFAQRNASAEQRMAGQRQRAAQAFAAAEAGVEWAVAQLDANRKVDDDMLATADPAAVSFRSRALAIDPVTGDFAPWNASPSEFDAICARGGGGWACRGGSGAPATAHRPARAPALADADAAPAFAVRLSAGDRPGTVRLTSTGCDRLAAPCDPASVRAADASARVEVQLAFLSALPTLPDAAVTTAGEVDAGRGAVRIRSPEPATHGVRAGGRIDAPAARPDLPPGATAFVDHDAALAAMPPERFFAETFGASRAVWPSRPPAVRIACPPGDCGAALEAAWRSAADAAVVQVDGDLDLAGPRTLGTPDRPLLLVVTGTARLDGAVALQGVLQADAFAWTRAAPPAAVRGALLAARRVEIDGPPLLERDAATLARLRHTAGAFVPIPGSWRDF